MKTSQGSKLARAIPEINPRALLHEIYWAAVRAAQPPLLLHKQLKVSTSRLSVETGQGFIRLPLKGKVYVLGAGKGADLTAPAWESLFHDRLEQGALLVRDRVYTGPLKRISIRVGAHPLPDQRSLLATEHCLRILRRVRPDDLVIFFLMGGASSLLVRPAPGLTLEDKRSVTELLLKSGMAIEEMNCVRKHLSSVKAGGLLRAAYPAPVLTLAISDVLGDDPAAIGSAPTFHDPTTYRDAWTTLSRHRLIGKIPQKVRTHLYRGLRGEIPETLKPGSALVRRNRFVLMANNRDALAAAETRARALGFGATIVTNELNGDTERRARELSFLVKRRLKGQHGCERPHCLLLGGETTVRVRGKGMGGRNQEFALVSALELAGCHGVHMLSAGTDGSDGPTPAAGAFVDGTTSARARALGLDPNRALKDNDSYNFFKRSGALFCPGPTGTNVLDLKIVLLY